MTTISKEAKLVIFINIFTVEPANQQRLVQLPPRVAQMSVRHAPGFISSALHRSLEDAPNVACVVALGRCGERGSRPFDRCARLLRRTARPRVAVKRPGTPVRSACRLVR